MMRMDTSVDIERVAANITRLKQLSGTPGPAVDKAKT